MLTHGGSVMALVPCWNLVDGLRVAAWLALAAAALAQDTARTFPMGGFDNQGSATFGYRFTDVKGYEPKFDELFNLRSGPRLLDFNLFGKARAGENRFADNYSLTTSGLGGDPFATTQFTVGKKGLYDLRAGFRHTRYYWNRNDLAALPNGLNGLTSNHDWATVRKFGSLNLLVHASNNLRFNFEYYRNSRDGVAFTTRSPEYFGAPSAWGSFARANPYYVIAPLNQMANRVTGGVDYTRTSWSLHYKLGYQVFDDSIHGDNITSLQRSINTGDNNTNSERLNNMAWSDSRRLSTPVSEFSYTGRIAPRLEMRGGYIFYRYSGPAALDFAFDGRARSGTQFIPYSVSMSGRAEVSEPNHVVDQGFTYKVNEWWRVLADYRYTRFIVDSTGTYRSLNGTVAASGTSDNRWRIGMSMLDFNSMFTPTASLLVRAGVRLFKNDVVMLQNGVTDQGRTRRINTVWPVLSVHYQPSKMFTVRADVEQINNGASYTRVTPHIDIGGRFITRFRPTEKFYIEQSALLRNRKLIQTDYRATIRSNAVSANYDFSEKLAVFGGFSYDDLFASNFVNFPRGPAPITNIILRDQTVTRIWQGGLRAVPVRGLGVNFAGNFVRTTGMGEITGEAPLYGPMSFPYATGSIYYDVPRLGRLTIQLQRTYYTEQLVPGNNFGANLLTVAWTRGF